MHISEYAYIGVPDPKRILGFVSILYVVVKASAYLQEKMHTSLASCLERYKLASQYIQIQELFRNHMQRIDRKTLKKCGKRQIIGVL